MGQEERLMSLYIPILSEVVGGVRDWMKGKQEIKKARVEGEVAVTRKAAENVATWEQLHAKGSQSSWKDEFWTIVFAIPLVFAFIDTPWFDGPEIARQGFEAFKQMPEWYQYTLVTMVLASFGIRVTGTIKNMMGSK